MAAKLCDELTKAQRARLDTGTIRLIVDPQTGKYHATEGCLHGYGRTPRQAVEAIH